MRDRRNSPWQPCRRCACARRPSTPDQAPTASTLDRVSFALREQGHRRALPADASAWRDPLPGLQQPREVLAHIAVSCSPPSSLQRTAAKQKSAFPSAMWRKNAPCFVPSSDRPCGRDPYCKISNRPAAPMPPPMHIVTTPYLALRRRPSSSRWPVMRAPDMP